MKLKSKLAQYLRQLLVLFAVAVFGSANAGVMSQEDLKDTRIRLGIKEGKIIEIMNEVSSKTDYSFSYEMVLKQS
jgi:hypothetical protein